jgi:hypothetical protein
MEDKKIIEWETIEQAWDHGGALITQRAHVPGGWLVRTISTFITWVSEDLDGHENTHTAISICFMPYPKEWRPWHEKHWPLPNASGDVDPVRLPEPDKTP